MSANGQSFLWTVNSPGPSGRPVVEYLLAATGQQGISFFLGQLEVQGKGIIDFGVGMLLLVGDVLEQGKHDALKVRNGHGVLLILRHDYAGSMVWL